MRHTVSVPGHQPYPDEDMNPSTNVVSPGYFATMGTGLVAGRDFTPGDREGAPPVVIVNETMARYFFRGESPLGRRIVRGRVGARGADELEIVGVVRDAKYRSLREPTPRIYYGPLEQNPRPDMTLHVRSTGDTVPLTAALRREIRALDPRLPVSNVRTLEDQMDASLAEERMIATLSSFFGALALGLAAIGLYGVVAYGVLARSREIGIRIALGAGRRSIFWMILRESIVLVFGGIALGLPAAYAAGRFVSSLLFGLSPADPIAIAGAAALLAAVALVAGYPAARQATRLDPIVALRYE